MLRDRPLPIAVGLSALLAAIYLVWSPHVLDLSAQTFRADLFDSDGFVIWNPDWYGGHTVPGYSLLYPPLGALLGPELVGALAAVASAWLFGSIALRAFGPGAWAGVIWFGAASIVAPLGGRTTFALGLAFALASVWSIQRARSVLAGAAGVGAALSSPVAAVFLIIGAGAVLVASRAPLPERLVGEMHGPAAMEIQVTATVAGLAAGFALLVQALAFPTDGYQPFVVSAWIWIPLAVAALAYAASRRGGAGVLVAGALLYLLVSVVAVAIETPLGGNTVRLGLTFAGPLLAAVVLSGTARPGPRGLALLVAACLPLLFWQWTATVRDVSSAEGDPSTEAAYYAPLNEAIERESGGQVLRVHVPPTRNRWESVHVAERFPLVWGWLRQLESDDFDFLEQDELDPEEYIDWVEGKGAGLIAVPDAEPDRIAKAERELIDSGGLGIEPVWEGEHWRLFRLEDAPGIVEGGRLIELEPDRIVVRARSEQIEIDAGYSSYLDPVTPGLCVERGPGDEIVLTPASATGFGSEYGGFTSSTLTGRRLVIEARLSLDGFFGTSRNCEPDPSLADGYGGESGPD